MCARIKEPFQYEGSKDFHDKLTDWIGDVLYDFLPEHDYEIRDEQIYTAYQIADAFCDKKIHLAEAGLGTGKTFAYLLSAIPYARFKHKPVIIACATTALQEQLAGETSDIHTLSSLLELDIDARMAKDGKQYICDAKVDENAVELNTLLPRIEEWLSKTKRGERSEIPTVSDVVWKKLRWDETRDCNMCINRGYCKLVKAREYYRGARDLIIVDHATFFKDLWSRKERIANGEQPILPAYSAVIFDEGHKIMLPAAMQAGDIINKDDMNAFVSCVEEIQGARDSFVSGALLIEQAISRFFDILEKSIIPSESVNRQAIRLNATLLKVAEYLCKVLEHMMVELQIEQELYTESLTETQMLAYESQLERGIRALKRFCKNKGIDVIAWVDKKEGSFVVVPRNFNQLLEQELYSMDIPIVFTSATLSNNGDFDYFARTIGLKEYTKSTVGSPFDIENQVKVCIPEVSYTKEDKGTKGIKKLISTLRENGGRALILLNSLNEMRKLRKRLEDIEFPFELLWEDSGERGYLIRKFKEEETSVLIGTNFWEGIDIPGDSLNLVVIWQLPFPALDPLIEVSRKEARKLGQDPVMLIDYPEMGLKLKQGCGRLIRTANDKGKIMFFEPVTSMPYEKVVMGAVPSEARVEMIKM